jgi:hypothetical protein
MVTAVQQTREERISAERNAEEASLVQELRSRLTIPYLNEQDAPFEVEAKHYLLHPDFFGYWMMNGVGVKNYFGLSTFDVARRSKDLGLFEGFRWDFQGFTHDDFGIASVVGEAVPYSEPRIPQRLVKTYLDSFADGGPALSIEYIFRLNKKSGLFEGEYEVKVPGGTGHSGIVQMEDTRELGNILYSQKVFVEMYARNLERRIRLRRDARDEAEDETQKKTDPEKPAFQRKIMK